MKVIDSKNAVLKIIKEDIINKNVKVSIDDTIPDSDIGKFTLDGKIARVVSPFNGFNPNISLNWFDDSLEQPQINRGEFFWYVFPIIEKKTKIISQYFICDYLRLRRWVLEFDAPLGNDHRDHHDWRCTIELLDNKGTAYFRWGDEPKDENRKTRIIRLNNIDELLQEVEYIHLPDEISDPSLYVEGAVKTVSVNIYERDSKAREKCIDLYGYDCVVCGINFEEIYGELGKSFIHVHHLTPLSEVGDSYVLDPINDLRPVCPNCHAMIHRKKPPLGIDEMKNQLQ